MLPTNQLRAAILPTVLGVLVLLGSCAPATPDKLTELEAWKLTWRMVESSNKEQYDLSARRFDTLVAYAEVAKLEPPFAMMGVYAKVQAADTPDMTEVLAGMSTEQRCVVCPDLARLVDLNPEPCRQLTCTPKEIVPSDTALAHELEIRYFYDQCARGNPMEKFAERYGLDCSTYTKNGMQTDAENRERLKVIFDSLGRFPTQELVGKEAMRGIFLIIQHADRDREWQRAQLAPVEAAVRAGDLRGSEYALLYDRIQVGQGLPQRYSTQASEVDPSTGTVVFEPVEDPEGLEQRRMEMGLMPIATYRKIMLGDF